MSETEQKFQKFLENPKNWRLPSFAKIVNRLGWKIKKGEASKEITKK